MYVCQKTEMVKKQFFFNRTISRIAKLIKVHYNNVTLSSSKLSCEHKTQSVTEILFEFQLKSIFQIQINCANYLVTLSLITTEIIISITISFFITNIFSKSYDIFKYFLHVFLCCVHTSKLKETNLSYFGTELVNFHVFN